MKVVKDDSPSVRRLLTTRYGSGQTRSMVELSWKATEVVFAPAAMDAVTLDNATPDSALIVVVEVEKGRAKPISLVRGVDIPGSGIAGSIAEASRVVRVQRDGAQDMFVFGDWTVERRADGTLLVPSLDVPHRWLQPETLGLTGAFDRFLPGRPPRTRRIMCRYPTASGPCGHFNDVESLDPPPQCVNGPPFHLILP